jgi:hypothetical protein
MQRCYVNDSANNGIVVQISCKLHIAVSESLTGLPKFETIGFAMQCQKCTVNLVSLLSQKFCA